MAKIIKEQRSEEKKSNTPVIFLRILFISLVLFLYGQTISYEFVMDDGFYITNNPTVEKGFSGIGEAFSQGTLAHSMGENFQPYRPLQVSLFCIEKALFGFNPAPFHFINILLYCLISMIIFSLLQKLFPQLHLLYKVLITLLFIVHPIHTEVVANVKSQDELLSSLFNFTSLLFFVKSMNKESSQLKNRALSILAFVLALFSKESSVAFISIFPLTLYLLYNKNVKDCIIRSVPYLMSGGLFLVCRYFALKDYNFEYGQSILNNAPYPALNLSQEIGHKLHVLFYFLKLLVIPYPLTWDYSYKQIPIANWAEFVPLFSLSLYVLIFILIIKYFRKRPEITFGLLFFILLIAPTAKFLLETTNTFGERFLFLPSFGFIIAVVYFILKISNTGFENVSAGYKKYLYPVAVIILIAFCMLSADRIHDWENPYTLAKSGAKYSPNSSNANEALANTFMTIAQESTDPNTRGLYIDSARKFYTRSLNIYPGNYKAAYGMALISSFQNNADKAVEYYKMAIQANPNYLIALNNIAILYHTKLNYDSSYYYIDKAIKVDSADASTLTNITIMTYDIGKNDRSIYYGEKAIALEKGNKGIYNTLSKAWQKAGNAEKAKQYELLMNTNQ